MSVSVSSHSTFCLLSFQQAHTAFCTISECSTNYSYSSLIQLNCLNPSLSRVLREIPDPVPCWNVCSDNYVYPVRLSTYITQQVLSYCNSLERQS